jgi:hypothetical protein
MLSRCNWENNIKMDPRENEFFMHIHFIIAQDREMWRPLVNTVLDLHDP